MLNQAARCAEAGSRARRVLLDLSELALDLPDRLVLVDTLKRRLGPPSPCRAAQAGPD